MKIVLLPGMDGTGNLFADFCAELAPLFEPEIIPYPTDIPQSIETLAGYVESKVPHTESYILLAESFSGRIAYEVAQRGNTNIHSIVLVATFLQNPYPTITPLHHIVPIHWLANIPIPDWILRQFLLGSAMTPTLADCFRASVRSIPSKIMRKRLNSIATMSLPTTPLTKHCLYLQATEDVLIPKRCVRDFERSCSNLTVQPITGKHFLLQSSPYECAIAVERFIYEKSCSGR
ncbi:MAG: hypothetical protein AAF639_39805 [Chloroflexota bacterium]